MIGLQSLFFGVRYIRAPACVGARIQKLEFGLAFLRNSALARPQFEGNSRTFQACLVRVPHQKSTESHACVPGKLWLLEDRYLIDGAAGAIRKAQRSDDEHEFRSAQ